MIGFVKIIFRRATVKQDGPVNGPVSSLKSSLQDERRKTKDERRRTKDERRRTKNEIRRTKYDNEG